MAVDATPIDAAPIEAVLFDADGVLQRARPGWRERLEEIGGAGFAAAIFVAEGGPLVGVEPFADAVRTVLVERGLDPDPTPVLRVWEDIDVDSAALEVVRRVRAGGTACYLATNQQDHRAWYLRQELHYGELFDGLFISSEMGVAKPAPAFFTMISDRLGLAPNRLLFIDDHDPNVVGARSVGLRAERHDPAAGAAGLERLLNEHGFELTA